MNEIAPTAVKAGIARRAGWRGIVADWSSDQQAFKGVPGGRP